MTRSRNLRRSRPLACRNSRPRNEASSYIRLPGTQRLISFICPYVTVMSGSDERNDKEIPDKDYPLHALDYHWDEFEPHLICHDSTDDEISEFDLGDVK